MHYSPAIRRKETANFGTGRAGLQREAEPPLYLPLKGGEENTPKSVFEVGVHPSSQSLSERGLCGQGSKPRSGEIHQRWATPIELRQQNNPSPERAKSKLVKFVVNAFCWKRKMSPLRGFEYMEMRKATKLSPLRG